MKKSHIDLCHLKRRSDIIRLFRKSKIVKGNIVTIRYLNRTIFEKNTEGQNARYLVVPQRNFGSSVNRNLIRRRVNEICRQNYTKLNPNFDIGIFVNKEALNYSYDVLKQDILNTLAIADILIDS